MYNKFEYLKSANIIASQSIKCNKTINLVNKNKDMDRIVNSYKLDEECNNTIFKKPSINKVLNMHI